MDILIDHLTSGSDDVIAMSADVISDIASSRRARKQIRIKGGLEILVCLYNKIGRSEVREVVARLIKYYWTVYVLNFSLRLRKNLVWHVLQIVTQPESYGTCKVRNKIAGCLPDS